MSIWRPITPIVVGLGLAGFLASVSGCGTNTNSAGTAGIATDQGKDEANKASADFYKANKLNKRAKR